MWGPWGFGINIGMNRKGATMPGPAPNEFDDTLQSGEGTPRDGRGGRPPLGDRNGIRHRFIPPFLFPSSAPRFLPR